MPSDAALSIEELTDIAGLEAWVHPDCLAIESDQSPCEDNDPIWKLWAALPLTSYLYENDALHRPVYRTPGRNGHPYWQFDGTSQHFKWYNWFPTLAQGDYWFAGDFPLPEAEAYWLGRVDLSFCQSLQPGLTDKMGYYNATEHWPIAPAVAGFHVYRFKCDRASELVTVYRDGILLGQGPYVDNADHTAPYLMSKQNANEHYGVGDLYEVAHWSQTLTDPEAAAVLVHLKAKYGIA